MKYENDIFIINYNDCDYYIDDVINYINTKIKDVMSFFSIGKLKNKIIINIIETKEEFDNIVKNKFNKEPHDWFIGYAINDSIYCVSLTDYKNTSHKFSDRDFDKELNFFNKTLIHEIVHIFNYEYSNEQTIKCLMEGIACYLSGQYDNQDIEFNITLEELLDENSKPNYPVWYLVVKYIIDNYEKEYLLKLICNRNFSINEMSIIYNEMSKDKNINREVIK